jgi:hypothetical protein
MSLDEGRQELNGLPAQDESATKHIRRAVLRAYQGDPYGMVGDDESIMTEQSTLVQWTTGDNRKFVPAGHTRTRLPPGVYEIQYTASAGLSFVRVPVQTEGLLRFPHSNSDRVVREIQAFWQQESIFREYRLAYKRGILLWGPPGSGKSCTIRLILQDVVQRSGLAFKFTAPALFLAGLRAFRAVERDTPVVVLMEDLDAALVVMRNPRCSTSSTAWTRWTRSSSWPRPTTRNGSAPASSTGRAD